MIAEGNLAAENVITNAHAERIRLVGFAQAEAIRVVGEAQARAMEMKAEAMSEFGRSAIVNMVLEAMPQIASQLCEPLQEVSEIVLTGGTGQAVEIEEVN